MIIDYWTSTAQPNQQLRQPQQKQPQQQMRVVADGVQLHLPCYGSGRRSQAASSRSSSCADLTGQMEDCCPGRTAADDEEDMDIMIAGPMDEDCLPAEPVQPASGSRKKSQRSVHRSFSRHTAVASRHRPTGGYGSGHPTAAALSTTPIDVWRQAAAAAAVSAISADPVSGWNPLSEASEEENGAGAPARPPPPLAAPRVITAGQRHHPIIARTNMPAQLQQQQTQQQIEYMNAQQRHQQFLIQQQYQQQQLAMIEQQRQQQLYINQQQQLAHFLRQQHQQQMIFAQQQRIIGENNKENNNNGDNNHIRKRFSQYERRPFAVREADAAPADGCTTLDDDLSVLSCDDENNSLNGDVHRNRRDGSPAAVGAALWRRDADTPPPGADVIERASAGTGGFPAPPAHFFSVGDIIGYSKVVRAERHEALGALNAAIGRFSDEWPEIRRGWEHNLRLTARDAAPPPAAAAVAAVPTADQ